MKTLFFPLALLLATLTSRAQVRPNTSDSNLTYKDVIYTDQINGRQVFESDSFNDRVQDIIKKKKIRIDDRDDYPKVYLTSKDESQYLKVWGGPDVGYNYFFTIGYTKKGKCSDCGTFIGRDDVNDYVINNGIKLGDGLRQVWDKAHLAYFRKFLFKGITYYYFEKGIKQEVPFTPAYIFYYQFDTNEKLVEVGFGYGMLGVNPMLH